MGQDDEGDPDEVARLGIGGGSENCTICFEAYGASRRNKNAYIGHGTSSAFQPQAHYGSEVFLTLF